MDPSVWEAVFFLLALKIPVVFVGIVVWRAIRAVPDAGEPEAPVAAQVSDTPPGGPMRPSRRSGGRPFAGPSRRPSPQRPAGTRTLDGR
jgi:hypothetical protein